MDFLNVIIRDNCRDTDRANLFPNNEIVHIFSHGQKNMWDLLVILEAFPSRSQARKNWKDGPEIPPGWNEWFIGKKT